MEGSYILLLPSEFTHTQHAVIFISAVWWMADCIERFTILYLADSPSAKQIRTFQEITLKGENTMSFSRKQITASKSTKLGSDDQKWRTNKQDCDIFTTLCINIIFFFFCFGTGWSQYEIITFWKNMTLCILNPISLCSFNGSVIFSHKCQSTWQSVEHRHLEKWSQSLLHSRLAVKRQLGWPQSLGKHVKIYLKWPCVYSCN